MEMENIPTNSKIRVKVPRERERERERECVVEAFFLKMCYKEFPYLFKYVYQMIVSPGV